MEVCGRHDIYILLYFLYALLLYLIPGCWFMYAVPLILALFTDGRKGVLEEAGGKQHNITQAAPNELKLAK